ncbi:MAG TPA: hypothetical protein VF037_02080 [Gemmatimonadales bacterium]
MSRPITPATSLDTLKQEAKRWHRALRSGDADAWARFRAALGADHAPDAPSRRDALRALAREHGFPGWTALKHRLENVALRRYDEIAAALVTAYRTPDPEAMRVVWNYFGHRRAWEVMRRYVRLDLGGPEEAADAAGDFITLAQARWLVARAQGFTSWEALALHTDALPPGSTYLQKPVGAFYAGDGNPLELPTTVLARDWDELLATMRERGHTALHANGQMTDAVLARVAELERIEELDLGGSHALTDAGLGALAHMPRLRVVHLGGCRIGDEGLAALGRAAALERVTLSWTRITDAGVAHLSRCGRLEVVDLSGTRTGDGAIRALAGLPALRHFRSGSAVTDAGIPAFGDYPVFRRWQGGDPPVGLFSYDEHPNMLLLRGSFSDAGLAALAACEGLYALNLDDGSLRVTGAGLVPLQRLPHLTALSFDAKDGDMPAIAALPHLRHLVVQDTSAGDDGFAALGRSRSLEFLWGRRCHNLRDRGFTALATIPTLRGLSVSCRNVSDAGLAALPDFPALTELMPMDVPDEGYRHVAACVRLESLVLMYCRDTGDRATGHIVRLPALRKYFASYNLVTDRTPALLATMDSLEEITFDSCAALTDAGVSALARLPRLRRLRVSGMRGVTRDVRGAFGEGVIVSYSP